MKGPDVPPPLGSMYATHGAASRSDRTAVGRAQVRLRQPWLNPDAKAHAPDLHAARTVSQAAGDEMIDTRGRCQDDIHGFPRLEPLMTPAAFATVNWIETPVRSKIGDEFF